MKGTEQKALAEFRAVQRLATSLKPSELRILLALADNESGATLPQIKALIHITQNAAFVALRRLREAGYVTREARRDRTRTGPMLMHYRLSLVQGPARSLTVTRSTQGGAR